MSLDGSVSPGLQKLSGRFLLVSYVPTSAAALFVLLLVWAGAPGPVINPGRAREVAAGLGAGDLLVIGAGITVLSLLLHPLQLAIVRLLEGQWPVWLSGLAAVCRHVQELRRQRLAMREWLPEDLSVPVTEGQVQSAGAAGARLRRLFPSAHLVRPTALGNVLAATEERAGALYGWDAVIAWPRLYPTLGERVRTIVDDKRDAMDTEARLTVIAIACAVVSAALLARAGWWLLLVLAPLLTARLAYTGAIQAALAYGEVVRVAFDLHRFDLLRALHLPLPDTLEVEQAMAAKLCTMWRQGLPVAAQPYAHDPAGGRSTTDVVR